MRLITFVSLCMLLTYQCDHTQSGDWPQIGHDNYHTYSTEAEITRNLEIKWQYQIKSPHYSSPAVWGERVYVFDCETLYCLNLQTGEPFWEVPAHLKCPSTPTVMDGRIYLAADKNRFQCLDAYTGSILWERELSALHWLNPLVDDSALYITVENLSYFDPMEKPENLPGNTASLKDGMRCFLLAKE